ncbi:hypothetical protein [Burkholderia cenocepacia]|uniref:hypothetical protein n=1 Tax=Burkholderia cenocepacia TaxID=95486 RepID=UPI00158BD978|nr:hypothetical protein [Burkholderia cenocepacia]MDS0850327.1 hypothetical protein [Burkholderia cenocepacia]
MLQTVKKGSSLHVVGRSAARIGEAARFGAPRDTREGPSGKARRTVVTSEKHGRRRPTSGRAIGKPCVVCLQRRPGVNDEGAEPPRRGAGIPQAAPDHGLTMNR